MDILEYTKSLRETRMRVANEMQSFVEDCHKRHPGEPFSAEEQAQWERYNARIDELEAQVRGLDQAATRERESNVATEALERQIAEQPKAGNARSQRQAEADMLRAFARGEGPKSLALDMTAAAEEKRMIRAGASAQELAEFRAIAWDTGSVASAVPTTTSRSLYEILEATIAMFRMPTTKINTNSGEALIFPKTAAHAIATQVIAQGTALAGTDPTFAKMTLDAFKYGELVKVASEVVSDTAIDVLGFITRDVGRALGRVIDTDLVTGSGSGKPNGVVTAIGGAGSIATGGSLIDPTYEKLVDLVYSVNDAYRSSGAAAWLMRDATAGVLRKLRDGAGGTVGAVLWEPSLTAGIQNGQPDRLLGYGVYTDPNVASLASDAKVILFGDFSSYYIRTVGPVLLERDDSRFFDTDEVAIRGKWRVDGDCIDTTALNVLKRSV